MESVDSKQYNMVEENSEYEFENFCIDIKNFSIQEKTNKHLSKRDLELGYYALLFSGSVLINRLYYFEFSKAPIFSFSDGTNYYAEIEVHPWSQNEDAFTEIEFCIIAKVPKRTLILSKGAVVFFSLLVDNTKTNISVKSINHWLSPDGLLFSKDVYQFAALEETSGNDVNAIALYKKAVLMKNQDAVFKLGLMYRQGIGTDKNAKLAFKLLLSSAKAGNFDAMNMIAEDYHCGNGTNQSDEEALFWLCQGLSKKDNTVFKNLIREWYHQYDLQRIKKLCDSQRLIINNRNERIIRNLDLVSKDVYLVRDTSIISTGSSGFAIAEDGLYYKNNKDSAIEYVTYKSLTSAFLYNGIKTTEYNIWINGRRVYFGSVHQVEYLDFLREIAFSLLP